MVGRGVGGKVASFLSHGPPSRNLLCICTRFLFFFSFPILIFTILCTHTQVIADWSVQNLSFSMFKTRGELLLKGAETSEIVSLMEDSLMVLGSLMSNR